MKYLRITLSFFFIVGVTSCSDFFEIERPPQSPWGSLDEFEQSVIGGYAGLFSGDQWNMAWVNERIVKSSMGDDVGFVSNPEWGYYRNTTEFNKYTEKNYALLYGVISSVNNALDFVTLHDGNPYPNETLESIENNLKRLVGELHFIRGYAYYILMTTFGHAYIPGGANSTVDIPLHTSFVSSAEDARNPAIGTTQELYDLILEDFKKAKELLPLSFNASKHHPSYEVRANKFAAASMLVRTYLQRGEYTNSVSECDFIIDQNKGAYDLTEDPIAAFNKNSKTRGKEVILYAPFYDASLPPPNHLSVLNHRWNGGVTTWVETYMAVSTVTRLKWMADPENDTTISINAKRDKRFTQLMAIRLPQDKTRPNVVSENRPTVKDMTSIWTNKYFKASSGMSINVPLIRLAEIYLTRSVLRFKAGDKAGATDDLNIVKRRAWNTAVGGEYVPITSSEITEEMIHDERLIELFNEGDRVDYLRGMKADIPRGDRGPGNDPYTSDSFVWAIPAIELNFNNSLTGG